MKVFIDQSGKVEQTNTPTVVAFANGRVGSVILSAKDKRLLENFYRGIKKPKMFSIQVFSSLVFLIIKKWKINKGYLCIDREYFGYEHLIKKYIINLCDAKKINISSLTINFLLVGKTSKCHYEANKNRKLNKADEKIYREEILDLLRVLLK